MYYLTIDPTTLLLSRKKIVKKFEEQCSKTTTRTLYVVAKISKQKSTTYLYRTAQLLKIMRLSGYSVAWGRKITGSRLAWTTWQDISKNTSRDRDIAVCQNGWLINVKIWVQFLEPTWKSQTWWPILVIPVLRRWRQLELWDSLASQLILLSVPS